jgi:hypothetical protein
MDDAAYYQTYVQPEEFDRSKYSSPEHFDPKTNEYVAYKDTRGFLTFGPGVLVNENLKRILGKNKLKVGDKAPKSVIDAESMVRWNQSVKEAEGLRGKTDSRLPVAEMIYQMGLPKVLAFTDMLKAVSPEAAETAALDSKWSRQTPPRAQEVAARLRESMTSPQPRIKPTLQLASDLVGADIKPTTTQDAPDNYIPGFLETMNRALGLK